MDKSLFFMMLLFSIGLVTSFILEAQEVDSVTRRLDSLRAGGVDVDALIRETADRLKINYEEQPSQTLRFFLTLFDFPERIEGFQCHWSGKIQVGSNYDQDIVRPGTTSKWVATSEVFFLTTDKEYDFGVLSEQEISAIREQQAKKSVPAVSVTFYYADSRELLIATFFSRYFNTSRGTEYHPTEFCTLGDACLVCPSEHDEKENRRQMLVFLKDNTAIEFRFYVANTKEMFDNMSGAALDEYNRKMKDGDVTPIAEYVVKRYKELTEELHAPPAFRQWTLEDAENKIEAKYQSSMDTEVTLESKDGEIIKVEMSRLSKPDQLYVQRRMEIARYEAERKASELPGTLTDSNGVPENADMSPNIPAPPTAKRGSVLVSVVVTLIILGLLAYGAFYFIRHYW